MWKFHWHHIDDEGKELTTTQTSVPTGEPIPVPPDVAANTITGITFEAPESEPAPALEAPQVEVPPAEEIPDLPADFTP
jgi:hypothetical protein